MLESRTVVLNQGFGYIHVPKHVPIQFGNHNILPHTLYHFPQLYYEQLLSMPCAGRRPNPKHFTLTMHNALLTTAGENASGGGELREGDPLAASAVGTSAPAQPATEVDAAAGSAEAAVAAAASDQPPAVMLTTRPAGAGLVNQS